MWVALTSSAQPDFPVARLAVRMRDSDNTDGVRQLFVNHAIGKADDPTRACRLVVKWKPLGIMLNLCQRNMDGTKELFSQAFALALVTFGCSNEFNIRFTMINHRLHEMAFSASRITSSARRSFALPD